MSEIAKETYIVNQQCNNRFACIHIVW